MDFENQKKQALLRPDRSLKGHLDKAIIPLVRKINSVEDYYTTSSCAGRIILMKETGKKQKKVFLFVSHEPVSLESIKKELDVHRKVKEMIYLKHEPCILHVACKDLESARKLVGLARGAGWKKSGIISRRNVIELVSTEILAAPVAFGGRAIVSSDYLDMLVFEANKKLALTRGKIKNLERKFKQLS